jgi:hypothetical protein
MKNPLPEEFIETLWKIPLRGSDKKSLPNLFSSEWKDLWGKLAQKYQGASTRYSLFCERDGLYFLQKLFKRRANPSFILKLFVQYQWNEKVNRMEHKTPNVRFWAGLLDLVREDQKRVTEKYVKLFSEEANSILSAFGSIERKIVNIQNERDLRELKKRPPDDKTNRTIFTLHQHLIQKTGGPQWENFWDLLVAAGVIKGGGVVGKKDRQIRPHIESFQKDHPSEASFIKDRVIPQKS